MRIEKKTISAPVRQIDGRITGMFYTNVITDNKTVSDGSVINAKSANADAARTTSEEIRL